VPTYKIGEPAHTRQLAGGAFTALVPNVLTVEPEPDDPDPLDYVVRLDVDVVDGKLVCTTCAVESLPGGGPVTAEVLRRVPIGRYLREGAARTNLVRVPTPIHGTDLTSNTPVELPPTDYAVGGMTDEVLHQTAKIFQWSSAIGDAPLGVLEREYGIPRAKASRWISTARRRGLLAGGDSDAS
jgi:hypothetical protein